MKPVRLTVVLTHPIQYYSPWFRHIGRHAPELELTVVHAIEPTAEQQGVGFGRPFKWDVALTEGYNSVTARRGAIGDCVHSGRFFGVDVPEIGDIIARTNPDVALITGWHSITLVRALVACRRRRIPTLYRGDSNLLSGPCGYRRLAWSAKTRVLLGLFDGFLCPGTRVREYLLRFGIRPDRIYPVPHAIDNATFAEMAAPFQLPQRRLEARQEWGIAPDAFVVLFPGKLVPSKRPLDIVRAVSRLSGRITFVVAGSGQLEGRLRAEAARLGVEMKLIGFLNQTELGRAYAIADCLTLPSEHSETWGLVVNEALATGLPVVVSDAVGCAPDLVRSGETGYTFPLGDIDALADRLDRVRARTRAGHDWRPACQSVLTRFSHDAMTAGLVRACRSVLPRSVHRDPDWREHSTRILACCGQMVINGGLERMTFEVLRVVCERGAAAHCIVNDWENFRITPLVESCGASWSTGPYRAPLTRRGLTPRKIWRIVREIAVVSAGLMREVHRIDATHVLIPDYQTALRNAPGLLALRLRGIRVIARLGNAPEPGTFYRRLWRYAINPLVDTFVSNSRFTARELRKHDVDPGKIVVIPNAAATRNHCRRPGGDRQPCKVVYLGQVIPEKGVDLLLEAVAILRSSGLTATLDIVGDMDGWEADVNRGYRASVRERASRPDLAGAVSFLGWREEVPDIFARCAIHCCPSRPEQREGFGNVVLEAKVAGLPSVVGPSGNLPDMVEHRVDGWVCAEATAHAVAEGLEFFLRNPRLLQAAGQAARASAAAYDRSRFADAWCDVLGLDGHRVSDERIAV